MIRRLRTILFFSSVLALAACEADKAVEPGPEVPEAMRPSLELRAERTVVGAGGQVQLSAGINNWKPSEASGLPVITYSSNANGIATVSASGVVKAIAPGTAIVSAYTSIAGVTLRDSVAITVVTPTILTELTLTAKPEGWEPTPAHVAAGATIEWRGGTITSSGGPVKIVWLMNMDFTVFDSLDLSNGPVSRSFPPRGPVRYCSGICWDPPDYGIIYIH